MNLTLIVFTLRNCVQLFMGKLRATQFGFLKFDSPERAQLGFSMKQQTVPGTRRRNKKEALIHLFYFALCFFPLSFFTVLSSHWWCSDWIITFIYFSHFSPPKAHCCMSYTVDDVNNSRRWENDDSNKNINNESFHVSCLSWGGGGRVFGCESSVES